MHPDGIIFVILLLNITVDLYCNYANIDYDF